MEVELINLRFDENRKRQGLTFLSTTELQNSTVETGGDFAQGHPADWIANHESSDVRVNKVNKLSQGDVHSFSSSGTRALTVATATEVDKSRKGSVDERILSLVTLINSTDDFFTTSTCSGRIILFANENETTEDTVLARGEAKLKKKGCKWLLVSHDEVEVDELLEIWRDTNATGISEVNFKVEPAILHIQCRKLSTAKVLLHAATESGFRNSGMVIGKENRITVAVRSAMSLDVPLKTSCESFVTDEFLNFLVQKANEKISNNWIKLSKFTEAFQNTVSSHSSTHPLGSYK